MEKSRNDVKGGCFAPVQLYVNIFAKAVETREGDLKLFHRALFEKKKTVLVFLRRRFLRVIPVHEIYQTFSLKGTNPALKKPSNIPEIYAKMFGRFH